MRLIAERRLLHGRFLARFVIVPILLWTAPAVLAQPDFEEAVAAHQKMVLLLDEASRKEGYRADVLVEAARYYYSHKRDALAAIDSQYQRETRKKGELSPTVIAFVSFARDDSKLRDGDKLAFLDLVEDFIFLERGGGVEKGVLAPLQEVRSEVNAVYAEYSEEYSALTGLLSQHRVREKWQDYIAYLRSRYAVEKLVTKEIVNSFVPAGGVKGDLMLKNPDAFLTKPKQRRESAEKTVVLTFDDGPHRYRTPEILDMLERYGMKAHFFVCGENLGRVDEAGRASALSWARRLTARMLKEGHDIGNHSYDHPNLANFPIAEVRRQLEQTNHLIALHSGETNRYFRPPYGSRNQEIDELVSKLGMTTVLWNVDSRDWAVYIPEFIADDVIQQVERRGGGVVLLHDIHRQTVEAVPLILEGLQERGYETVALVH